MLSHSVRAKAAGHVLLVCTTHCIMVHCHSGVMLVSPFLTAFHITHMKSVCLLAIAAVLPTSYSATSMYSQVQQADASGHAVPGGVGANTT